MSKALYTLALTVAAALAAEGCATTGNVTITAGRTAPTKQEAAKVLHTHSSQVSYLRNRALRESDVNKLTPLAAVYAGIGEVRKTRDGFKVVFPGGSADLSTTKYNAALEQVLLNADRDENDIITLPEIFGLSKQIYDNMQARKPVDYMPPVEKKTAVAKAPVAPAKSSGYKPDTRMVPKQQIAKDSSDAYKRQAAMVQRSPFKTNQDGYLLLENNLNTIEVIAGIYAGAVTIEKKGDKLYVRKDPKVIIQKQFRLKALKDADRIGDKIITPMELNVLARDVYEQSARGVAVLGPTNTQPISRDLVARVQEEPKAQPQKPAAKPAPTQTRKQQIASEKKEEQKAKAKKKSNRRGWKTFHLNYTRKHHGRRH